MSLVEKLVQLDRQLFLFLNSCHTDGLDQLFYVISSDWIWLPLYLIFIALIINKLKLQSIFTILIVVLGVAISDQGANLLKKQVKRLRPTHDPVLADKVHTVNDYRGGTYGFVSSHAANTFCVAWLISNFLSLRPIFVGLLFFWATIVSYSRMYLGVHFPLDVACGAILGLMIAIFLCFLKKKGEMLGYLK